MPLATKVKFEVLYRKNFKNQEMLKAIANDNQVTGFIRSEVKAINKNIPVNSTSMLRIIMTNFWRSSCNMGLFKINFN